VSRDDEDCRLFLESYYNGNGSLWVAVWDHWEVDEDGYVADSYAIDAGREFRFDSPRARYLVRDLDPATLTGSTPTVMPLSPQLWTMYDGDEPYLDFDVDDDGTTMTQTDTKQYVAGLAELDLLTSATSYLHGDLIRSLVMTTDDEGAAAAGAFAYTAFGEPAGAADPLAVTRYTYAGGWGYEDGLIVLAGQDPDLPPLTLSHVGARWYQPDIGRFVQRDPIGIEGGLNGYSYCGNAPSSAIDPDGTEVIDVGEPLPSNPTPYPRPPGMRNHIVYRPAAPRPPRIPWYKPNLPPTLTAGRLIGAVGIAFCVGYAVGTVADQAVGH